MLEAEERIGYAFTDKALLNQALTHPSFGGDYKVPHYQRLEFLGDAVLEMYVSERLYKLYPDLTEGKLTRMRADLVCEESLSRALSGMGLEGFIRLSVGEMRTGGQQKPSIRCDVFEAILGAIYLDGGFEKAGAYIERALGESLTRDTSREGHFDYKSSLQTLLQAQGTLPVYELISCSGPAHAPVFEYSVARDGVILGRGSGHSKQAAQLEAAKQALEKLAANAT